MMSMWASLGYAIAVCMVVVVVPIIVRLITCVVRLPGDLKRYLATYPDAAYDHFVANPSHWAVFHGIPSISAVDKLPRLQRSVWGAKPVGPFTLRVPRLQNRVVTVYGISKDFGLSLATFVSQMRDKEKPTQRQEGTVEHAVSVPEDNNPVDENDPEVECLECGALVARELTKCPKCGWTWLAVEKEEDESSSPLDPDSGRTNLARDAGL
jgi:ribosomal protein L40E